MQKIQEKSPVRKPKLAKNERNEPRYLKEEYDIWSHDKNIWDGIVAQLAKEHQVTPEDITKIIAFCFRGWGGRIAVRGGWKYWVSSADILDCKMGWVKFKAELDRAIRSCRGKLSKLDKLWNKREGYIKHNIINRPPELEDSCGLECLDNEAPYQEQEDMELLSEKEQDRLLYGVYEDD